MTRRSSNQSTNAATMKGMLAGAALIAAGLVSAPAAADYDMAAMNDDIMLLLGQLEMATTPMSVSVSATADGLDIRGRIVGFEGRLAAIGQSMEGFSASESGDYRYSTWDLWIKADAAYRTLLTRCEYIRDNAAAPAGRPNLAAIGQRLQQMEIGSQQVAAPQQPSGRVNLTMVENTLIAIDDMLFILQDKGHQLTDPGTDDYRFSTWELHQAVSDIYARVQDACPAN